ncbi:MAG: hypothetical protein U0869_26380, partial [Chloroflexota bacterium]
MIRQAGERGGARTSGVQQRVWSVQKVGSVAVLNIGRAARRRSAPVSMASLSVEHRVCTATQ